MSQDEYNYISSEIHELESLLKEIPQERVIARFGLEQRLKTAKELLESIKIIKTVKARLTFKGKPVYGSHGITAEFGTKAVGTFTDAVAAVAASFGENLKFMGPIPYKHKNQLLITGTAIGSFGFEFELPQNESEEDVSPTENALEMVQDIFRLTATGTDDEIAELVDVVHPRAVRKVSEFLEYLAQQEAWCGLDFNNEIFRFDSLEQLSQSTQRLRAENIVESEEEMQGELRGVLPSSRSFEFQTSGTRDLIKGRIALDFGEPDVLNRDYLHKPLKIKFQVIKFGQGRPRYSLASLDKIEVISN